MWLEGYSQSVDDMEIVRMESVRLFAQENEMSVRLAEIEFLKQMIVPYRYVGNVRFFGMDGQIKLLESKVCVIGCGGLGGTICEVLSRLGIGRLVLVDPDTFEEHNLNRQLMCTQENIGKVKVECAKERIGRVNSAIEVQVHGVRAGKDNFETVLAGCNLCMDALDNVTTRLDLEKYCIKNEIPLVHGAIGDAQYQIGTIVKTPILRKIFSKEQMSASAGNPSPTVTVCAAMQAGEAVKVLTGIGEKLDARLLLGNWMYVDCDVIDFE